jgi:hypothetical protein
MARKAKKTKRASHKKNPVYWIRDENVSHGKIYFFNQDEILEYIKDNILDVLRPEKKESDNYEIGTDMMTDKQFHSLPDVD